MLILKSRPDCSGKVGGVGFCYGGGVALQCALAKPATDASVAFYGRALAADQVARVNTPLMMHDAGNDKRVDAMISDFRKALDENKIAYRLHMYPGMVMVFTMTPAIHATMKGQTCWHETQHGIF